MRFTTLFLGLALVAVIVIACAVGGASPAVAAPTPPQHAPQPVRYVVGLDGSGSAAGARIRQITTHDFGPLIAHMEVCGGELAFGLIRDKSDLPLIRLFLSARPTPPTVGDITGNAFIAADAKRRQNAEQRVYEERLAAWRKDADAKIAAFRAAVAPLLARPADAPRTDIRSFILRADLMLSEPQAFSRPARGVVLLITDGIETVSKKPLPAMKAKADVVIVNGIGSVGSLTHLAPTPFESLDAAIRYVTMLGGNDGR